MQRIAFRSAFAAALILAGVAALLVQAGVMTTAQAWHGFRAWPVLLIAWGLEALFHAKGRPMPVLIAPALVTAGVLVAWFAVPGAEPGAPTGPTRTQAVTAAEGPVEITVDLGAADLEIGPGGGSEVAVDWTGAEPAFDAAPGRVNIRGEFPRDFPDGCGSAGGSRWAVRLPDLPVGLAVRTGAAQVRADLSKVRLASLDVKAGASGVRVTLPPPAGTVPIQIDAGASSVDLDIPAGAAIRVTSHTALGNTDVSGVGLEPGGDTRATAGWDQAKDRYDVKLQGGVASLSLRSR